MPVTGTESWTAWRRVSRGSYKPFLHRVTKGRPTTPARLIVTRRAPRTLDAGQVAAILAVCERLRDRFLFALLSETGMFSGGKFRHAGLSRGFGRSAAGQRRRLRDGCCARAVLGVSAAPHRVVELGLWVPVTVSHSLT